MAMLDRTRSLGRALVHSWHNAQILSSDLGQFHTQTSQQSTDKDGQPLPWFTYSAIEYLKQFDYSGKTVFEYGAGNSTRFWAARARHVTSVEHDQHWYTELKQSAAANTTLLHIEGESGYVNSIRETGASYDVIVLDGWYRKRCAQPALERLNPGGIIVLDNADWLADLAAVLRQGDLIEVDFSDFGPICPWRWTTSVFLSRSFNFPIAGGSMPHPPRGGSPAPESALAP